MGRSYNNWKQNLNEQEQKLLEIGQLVQPYISNFNWNEHGNTIQTEFKDDKDNLIEVMFHKFKQDAAGFEAEFIVNKNSIEAFKTNIKHFFKIISTVIYATNDFIKEYKPTQLFIEGEDKKGKEGQKNKIWLQYFKVNIEGNGYVIGNMNNGFMLQKQ
jgi:hypothetical protein